MTAVRFRKFSIIIPVYNRPDELAELLSCIAAQTFHDFEVVIVEDGSRNKADAIAESFRSHFPVRYYYKENGGQGFARNYGLARATGDFFVILDSDALIEPGYLETVYAFINTHPVDIYGGPDTDHPDFTPVQKAISYAMTSVFTTGGIRGKKQNLGGTFHPRSFNMGFSREVWEKTGGFLTTRMGEDIIFSIRAIRMGFRTALIPEAFIYHKRRTRFSQFYRQLKFFGRARINIARHYPDELKAVHFFPALFTLGIPALPVLYGLYPPLFYSGLALYSLYTLLLFTDAFRKTGSLPIALLSIRAAYTQLTGYGIGFLQEGWKRLRESPQHKETGATIEYPS